MFKGALKDGKNCYTSTCRKKSFLQRNILSLFCDQLCLMPNGQKCRQAYMTDL